jgi:hypothetical protein
MIEVDGENQELIRARNEKGDGTQTNNIQCMRMFKVEITNVLMVWEVRAQVSFQTGLCCEQELENKGGHSRGL